MDRVDSLRWRLRAFWRATLRLFGLYRAPNVAYFRTFRKGKPPVREGSPPLPSWGGPPDDEVGVAVAVRTVLISQPRVFIAVTDCVAYSNGFSLSLAIRSKDDIPPRQMGFGGPPPDIDRSARVRIGIRFSDGRAAAEDESMPNPELMSYFKKWSEGEEPETPTGPVIGQTSGGGGGRTYNFNYFIWPLPPDGPVTITCRWPARGLQAAGKELNGTAIRAAGLKSHSVWS